MVDIRSTLPLVLLCALALGCHGSPWSGRHTPSEQALSHPSDMQRVEAAKPATANPAVPNPAASTPTSAAPAAQAMQEVIAQVQNLKDLDPAKREQLLADLQKTDPRYWPQVVRQMRATMAYRQQTQHRLATEVAEAGAASPRVEVTPTAVASTPGVAQVSPVPNPNVPGPNVVVKPAPALTNSKPLPTLSAVLESSEKPQAAVKPAVPDSEPDVAPVVAKAEAPAPLSAEPAKAPAASESTDVVPASFETSSEEEAWSGQLEQAIRSLEDTVASTPQSADEVAEHARLRLLYLVAGRRDDALRPIPSATPSVQDFWSKELFGLVTWLDTQQIDNPEARAAESRQHLNEALVSLGLASKLLVRNMAFANKIDGFGDYRPFADNKFAPGQEILVYAELENFRSESTTAGYATSLRISWQILDSNGQRVASDESKSDEVCRSLRRDFYISYRLFLPDRIYNGPHTFQLTVEDMKSQKIGQQTLEFTIIDASK